MASDATWGAPGGVPGGRPNGPPSGLPPLDPGVLRVIRSSAIQLAGLEDSFIQQLHSDAVALIPDLASHGQAFCERLVRSLLWLATTGQPPRVAADTMRRVGAMNRLEGFSGDRYVDVARALVLAVRNVSGDSWDNSMGSAWISYFRWAMPYLLAGAEQAAGEQAAAEQAAARQAAARREAARHAASQAQALLQDSEGGQPAAGDVDLEAVAGLLDEEDEDENAGYGQIMLSMTRSPRRQRPDLPS